MGKTFSKYGSESRTRLLYRSSPTWTIKDQMIHTLFYGSIPRNLLPNIVVLQCNWLGWNVVIFLRNGWVVCVKRKLTDHISLGIIYSCHYIQTGDNSRIFMVFWSKGSLDFEKINKLPDSSFSTFLYKI